MAKKVLQCSCQCSTRLASIFGSDSDVESRSVLFKSPISRTSDSNLAESRFAFSRKMPNCFETRSTFSTKIFVADFCAETFSFRSVKFLSNPEILSDVSASILDVLSFNDVTLDMISSKHDFKPTILYQYRKTFAPKMADLLSESNSWSRLWRI